MKIAIPLVNGRLAMHFGHCEQFVVTDVDEATCQYGRSDVLVPPPHTSGMLPRWLHEHSVNVMITSIMGRRAQEQFAAECIRVVYGVASETHENVLQAFLEGSLS